MSVQIVVDSKLAATNRTVNTFLKKTTRFFIMADMRGFRHKEEAPANESGASSLVWTTSTYHFRYKVVAITTVMGINSF
jgi:hypothetical protein